MRWFPVSLLLLAGCATVHESPRVRASFPNQDLLVLNLGTEGGLKEGESFTIHRGSRFVARGKVVECSRHHSLLKIHLKVKEPEVGDRASNLRFD